MKNSILNIIAFVLCFAFMPTLTAQNYRTESIQINNIGKLCPNSRDGNLVNGDHEFGGRVISFFKVSFYNTGNKIEATIQLNMNEYNSNKDRTKIKASWIETVYTAPVGFNIENFELNSLKSRNRTIVEQVSKVTDGAGPEFGHCNDAPSSYARLPKMNISIEYKGDTGSSDVSSDRDCHCDSRIEKIRFQSRLKVNLKQRQVTAGTYYINAPFKDKVLTVQGNKTANGTKIQVYKNFGQKNQKFTLENAGGGYFYIKAQNGKYLHIENNSGAPKAFVVLGASKGNDNTKWHFIPIGQSNYCIISKKGVCLDAQLGTNGSNAPIWTAFYTGQPLQHQLWSLSQDVKLL